MFRALLFSIFLAVFAHQASAFADPRLEAHLTPQKLRAGDTATLTLQIDWPKSEGQYTFALPDLVLDNFHIVNRGESQETYKSGGEDWTRKVFSIELEALEPREAEISPMTLPYLEPNQQKSGEFQVSGFKAAVLARPARLPAWILFVAGGGAGFGAAFAWGASRRRGKMPPPAPKDLRQEQLLSLKLAAEQLPGPEAISDFGRGFREFLQVEYRLNLTRPTDSELIAGLKNCGIPREESAQLERVIQKMTEAKYVGGSMPGYEFKSLQQDLIQYLQGKMIHGNTTPV